MQEKVEVQVKYKSIDLKNLDKKQKEVIREINQDIIEHQDIFNEQPRELLVSKTRYRILTDNNPEQYSYLLLGNNNIKIYSI